MKKENVTPREPAATVESMFTITVIEDWLVTRVSELLGASRAEIDVREPLANYGMSSMAGVSLSADLEDWLGSTLSPTLAWDYPTIELLSKHLAGESLAQQSPGRVELGSSI
jgi:acyl carrier protein